MAPTYLLRRRKTQSFLIILPKIYSCILPKILFMILCLRHGYHSFIVRMILPGADAKKPVVCISTYSMVAYSGKRTLVAEEAMKFIEAHEWGLVLLDGESKTKSLIAIQELSARFSR